MTKRSPLAIVLTTYRGLSDAVEDTPFPPEINSVQEGTLSSQAVTDLTQPCNNEDVMHTSHDTQGTPVSLDDFRKYADKGTAVAIVSHHAKLKVIAVGTTPDGRAIAWLDPDIDTARHFMSALDDTFGTSVGAHTARELALTPQPGKALASTLVHRAIDMAHTAKTAMDGVDFLQDFSGHESTSMPFFFRISKPVEPK